jgi:hypothetical protein
MKRLVLACALLAAAAGQVTAEGCLPADAGVVFRALDDAHVRAALRTEPATIKVGAPFVVALAVCSDTGAAVERLAIDATMPAHRHGMNYKPSITAIGDGRYEGRGFLFHMPGAWEFAVTVYTGGAPSRLKLDVVVK